MKISYGIFLLFQPYIMSFFNGACGILLQVNMGLLMDIHLLLELVFMLPLMEAMQFVMKFAQRRYSFIYDFIDVVKVCQGQMYTLYCDNNSSFQGDKFQSFHGLIQFDHQQIHMKWVTNYDLDFIQHLTFVLNGERIWAHSSAIFSETIRMFPMI